MTIRAQSYRKAINEYMKAAHVTSVACPLLASMIEEGCPSEEARRLIVREYVRPLREEKIDTLLLGCTHYPLATALIQEEIGPDVTIINPAVACAEDIAALLPPWEESHPTRFRFFASDDPERFKAVGESLLGMSMGKVSLGVPTS
jgi:glutamate racemase